MGEPGGDADRPSSLHPLAVNSPNMPNAPGEGAAQGSRRGSEEREAEEERTAGSTPEQVTESAAIEETSKKEAPVPPTGERRSSAPADVDKTSTPAEPAQSHPMTTTTSASSHLSNKDSTPPPAAYGTRSRNRPNAPRPNYAEDVEMDFEMAPQPNGGDRSSMDLSSHSPPATDSRQSPGPSAKRGAQAANGWSAANTNASIPGTSLFPVNPNARMSHGRKRKAAEAQGASAAQSQSPAPSSQAVTRRANAAATTSTSAVPETNMFSFEKCRSVLNKQGKLVADDGTVFSVNGRPPYFVQHLEPYFFDIRVVFIVPMLTWNPPRSRLPRMRTSR